jgi:hypothetical protein
MAAVASVTLIKKFTYRGDANEQFSNTYSFTGSVPSDPAGWTGLVTQLATAEKVCYPSTVSIIKAYCYATDNEDDDSVFSYDWGASPVAGTLSTTGAVQAPGDSAVWVRWKTSRMASGKAIYLRKYFHPAMVASASGGDGVHAAQQAALNVFGAGMHDGSFAGSRTIRSRHHDETILSHSNSTFVTTRTLKRRGKRPGS